MESTKVEFIYKCQNIDIYCSKKEIMKDIIIKFCTKVRVEKNSIYCLYSGKVLDENIQLENLIKSKNENENITILVYNNGEQEENQNDNLIKSPQIICSECQEVALIKLNKYKISTNCKNNHSINNIFLKDFEKTQKIDESKIICNECQQKNKSKAFDRVFYICLNCKKNLCPLCNSSHNKKYINHIMIKYEQKNFVCFEHGENYSSYCYTCKKNLCIACEVEHSGHNVISLGKLFPNKNDLNKRLSELKENINKLKNEINNIIELLNGFIKNIDLYYNLNEDINNSFNIKSINYEMLNNIKEINNNNVIFDDIKKIINGKTACDKFKCIFDIYNSMNTKENIIGNNLENNFFNNMNINNQNIINNNFGANNQNYNYNMNIINNNNLNQNIKNNNNNFNNFNLNDNMMNNAYNNNNNNNNGQNNNINNFYNQNQNMNINNNNYNPMMGMMKQEMTGINPLMMNMNEMMQNNYAQDEEWMKGFQLGVEEMNSKETIFTTIQGHKTNINVKKGTTIDELLRKYLKNENREYLINNKEIVYLYNGTALKFGNNTKIETFFEDIKPQIVVNDVYHLIGEGNSNIVFKHSKDSKIISFIFGLNSTIEDLLDYYFVKLGKPKSLLNKNIQFLYNAKLIQSLDMKTKIKDFFKNIYCSYIFVNE